MKPIFSLFPQHLFRGRFLRGALLPAMLLIVVCQFLPACQTESKQSAGSIERLDPGLDSIISEDVPIEVIAEGFNWSEGPLWVEDEKMLLFSDVPENKVYKWTEDGGLKPYLSPSGYTGAAPRGGETGSNGLLLNEKGQLVLCQHGDRRLAVMDAPLNDPAPEFIPVADNYQGKKFNSPNDAVMRSNGDFFFTDPPYGMEKRAEDPAREIPFHGVYKAGKDGRAELLTDSITRPNGIALTPDEKTLIIANSDPGKAIWYTFELDGGDSLVNPGILWNVTAEGKSEAGLPDGLKIDGEGTVFASGPGGVWIFGKDRKLLGKIKLPVVASNCALADNDRTLYITADSLVLRVKMR